MVVTPAKPIAWVTGAHGLIGHNLVRTAPLYAPQWNVTGPSRQELDLLDFGQVRTWFRKHRPRLIIHCAALSRNPACQADPVLARRLNVDATACLAEVAAEISLLFLSSDLVFDGSVGWYDETARVNPLSVYAETKVGAERVILANPRHSVIRISLTGGASPTGDRGFNEELRRAWRSGQTVRLFTDEFRCATPVAVTAQAIWTLATLERPGLYHLAGRERLSRWEIGQLVAARWPQLLPRILPGSLRDYPGAPRPPDVSLNCAKLQQLLPFPLAGLREWLAAHPGERF